MIAYLNSLSYPTQSFLLGLLATLIIWLCKPRTKLLWSKTHGYCHSVGTGDNTNLLVYNDYYIVQNCGRKCADKVEVVFNYKPQTISIWPQRDYRETTNREGRYILSFDNLAPREFININLLQANTTPPDLLNLRNPDGVGRQINTRPLQVYSASINILIILLLFIGFCNCIYVLLRLLNTIGVLAAVQ
jgi:hypothetical protein